MGVQSERVEVLGHHVLLDLYGCDIRTLNDVDYVRETLIEASQRIHTTIVSDTFHRFSPHGVSGVVVIAESHLSIHTWPEKAYAAFDAYTCGDPTELDKLPRFLTEKFRATRIDFKNYSRGLVRFSELPNLPVGE
jgi:S-adenosylmethionine decarboxylase